MGQQSNRISPGAIAGIVVGALLACSASAVAVYCCLRGRGRKQPTPYQTQKGQAHPRISIDTSRAARFTIKERAMNLQMLNTSPSTDTDHDSFSVSKRDFSGSVVLDIRKHSDEFSTLSSPASQSTSVDAAPSTFSSPVASSMNPTTSSSISSATNASRLRSRSIIKGDYGKRYSEPNAKPRPRASTSDLGKKLSRSPYRRSSFSTAIPESERYVSRDPAAPTRPRRPLPTPPTGRPPTIRPASSHTDSGIRLDVDNTNDPIPWRAFVPHYDTRPPVYTP